MAKGKFSFIISCCFLVSVYVHAQESIVKVACVGNSITAGYGLQNPDAESYPAQLQTLLPDSVWLVTNYGVSARTMLKTGDLPYWNEPQYKQALASEPNYVVIKLGTNDSKRWIWNVHGSEYKADYAKMIQSFRALPSNPEIFICLAIPGENQGWDIYNSYIKDSLNPRITEVAYENCVNLIDLNSVYRTHEAEYLLGDSVHPNIAGCKAIAIEIQKAITQAKPEITYVNGVLMAPKSYAYQWYWNNELVSEDDGGTSQDCVPEKPGVYTVLIQYDENNQSMYVSKEFVFEAEKSK